ncbi:MAG: hypothetical protein ACXVEF_38065 [Polyangiales bacterium]
MRAFRRALAILLAISHLGGAAVAFADPTASDKETARALMKEGDVKREKGDFKGAYENFKAAHAIMGVPTTGYLLGRSQVDLGMLVEARDTLLAVTRMPPQPGENETYALARAESQKLADEIEPKIPSIKVTLSGVPEGATPSVTIDGQSINAATIGVARKHNPGAHAIVVTVAGTTKKETVELKEGETREITIDVAAHEAPPPPTEHESPKPETPEETHHTSPLVYAGFGGAAVFGIVGAITGGLAFSKASAAKDNCDGNRCPPAAHDDISSSKTFGTISTVAFALTGVGLAVGVYGLFSGPSDTKTARITVHVGATSLALSGHF